MSSTEAAAPIAAEAIAWSAAPKATTMTATSSPSSETPLNARRKPVQSKPSPTASSTCCSPMPVVQPYRETLRTPDCHQQVVAGLLAAAAGCGADAAVLVVIGVPLALVAAGTAR